MIFYRDNFRSRVTPNVQKKKKNYLNLVEQFYRTHYNLFRLCTYFVDFLVGKKYDNIEVSKILKNILILKTKYLKYLSIF